MLTNKQQKDKLLEQIKKQYGFISIYISREDMVDAILDIKALKDGTSYELKYEEDKLFIELNKKWVEDKNFIFDY